MNKNKLNVIWKDFNEEDKENIMKSICLYMKRNFKTTKNNYSWYQYIKKDFNKKYNKLLKQNVFNYTEISLIENAYSLFEKYLYDMKMKLINNNLSFDNIYYENNKLIIPKPSKRIVAPSDYALRHIYLIANYKEEYCNDEIAKKDFERIILYIRKYFPEIVNIRYLYKRLAIYNMLYFMGKCLEDKNYKNKIIIEAKNIYTENKKSFNDLKTPEELMTYMDENIEFGWIDKTGNKHYNNIKNLRKNYLICSVDEIIKYGLGLCIEQAKLEKYFFDKNKIENKIYCFRYYEDSKNYNKDIKLHCFTLYKENNSWYYFEHTSINNNGIHKYSSVEEALNDFKKDYEKRGEKRLLTEINNIPDNINYYEFNKYVNSFDNI